MKKIYLVSGLFLGIFMAACDSNSNSTSSTTESSLTSVQTSKSAGENLIDASDCRGCHALDTKVVGPSYQEIAKKYENNIKNIETLVQKIINGGQGNWGEIPMSAHPDLKTEDAKEIVKYILSQKF